MDKWNNKPVYLCDPEKNVSCSKEICYISGGICRHTFNKAYEKKKQTNQDKLAEMVRTEDPEILADMIYDHTVCSTETTPGLHYCPLASTCTKQGSQSKMECIYDICDWLKETAESEKQIMGYKVINFNNETVRVGFSTEGAAWNWLYSVFTKDYIKDAGFKVVKEEDNDD